MEKIDKEIVGSQGLVAYLEVCTLVQLLIEKGVISKEEFNERRLVMVRELAEDQDDEMVRLWRKVAEMVGSG